MTYDRARWYPINGEEYPSVTTFLDVINKPALGPWYAKEERRLFEAGMLELMERGGVIQSAELLAAVMKCVTGVKAADKEKAKAATIGMAAHAWIEWETRRRMGEKVREEPQIPDAALWAVMAWQDWAKKVAFTPLAVERVVYCTECGYAGTADWIAEVEDIVTLGDYKTGKAIYSEAFLQNAAYRHAARRQGLETAQGIILRLPKVDTDPAFEAMVVPETPHRAVIAALTLWKWQRWAEGKPAGPKPRLCELA